MTRLDTDAEELIGPAECDGPRALVLEAREVPLGGVRGMHVTRVLPHRDLPMVGAWCFLDRFGPQDALMRVEPHPHIGLQTVTWPYVGEVRHRDSLASDVVVRRGQLNLMTSGAGISHSEYSVGNGPVPLDALQLWVALPESARHGAPGFEQHEKLPELALSSPEGGAAGEATVVLGELAEVSSPATVYTPIVGAELRLAPRATARIRLRAEWEHALLGVVGDAVAHTGIDGGEHDVAAERFLYLGIGRDHVDITASDQGALVFLIGGEPFPDEIVMWWNFVARTHDEIVEAREDWESGSARFGHVTGHGDERIPAPPLPAVRLTARRRRI